MTAKPDRIEELKRAKDGLDVWDDIRRYAEGPYEAIDADDLERFKWYGLYRQRPRDGFFMLRVKTPGGALTAVALRRIGEMARRYARNVGDITTRQDLQLHWITHRDVPALLDVIYRELDMYQEFACGDGPRNVTACPLAGELATDRIDGRRLAQAVSDMFRAAGKEFSNLPRKLKIAVSTCPTHCVAPQTDCLALFAAERPRNGGVEHGLGVSVGGGLRDPSRFGESLRVFLKPDAGLITDVCRRVAQLFRDEDSLRQGRLRARLKFHVARIGWQAFRDQLERRLGYPLEHDESIVAPAVVAGDDHGGGGRLKSGLAFVGVPVPGGRLTGDQMVRLADLADKYGRDPRRPINTTIKQNILLLHIAPGDLGDLKKELADIGLPTDAPPIRRQVVSCTGIQFCNLAVVETKERARRMLAHLEANVPTDKPIFIAVSGCPNACSQHTVADIGLQGTLASVGGRKGVEHFHILVGGRMGPDPRFARPIGRADGEKIKVPADRAHLVVERIIRAFQRDRLAGESFSLWAERQTMPHLADLISAPDEPAPPTPPTDATEAAC